MKAKGRRTVCIDIETGSNEFVVWPKVRRPSRAFTSMVNQLTNHERNEWARMGYPGLREKDDKLLTVMFPEARQREVNSFFRSVRQLARDIKLTPLLGEVLSEHQLVITDRLKRYRARISGRNERSRSWQTDGREEDSERGSFRYEIFSHRRFGLGQVRLENFYHRRYRGEGDDPASSS